METYEVLYNPLAGSGSGAVEAKHLQELLPDAVLTFQDMTAINYVDWLNTLDGTERLMVAGGDGTLNRFINDTAGFVIKNPIYYFATGSGNDFLRDLKKEKGCLPVEITQYLHDLPTVTVKGKTYAFLNGVGYGIDGYCCEVGDAQREQSDKPVNYAGIAIKGLLFHYRPTNASVTVDGVTHTFPKTWLAPTMNGHFYGGGMIPTPDQDRLNPEKTVSVMVMHGTGKLKTLTVFPSIFKGEHVKHTEMVSVLTGHTITVAFDRPVALQIDGETILNVTSYTVHSGTIPSPATRAEQKEPALV